AIARGPDLRATTGASAPAPVICIQSATLSQMDSGNVQLFNERRTLSGLWVSFPPSAEFSISWSEDCNAHERRRKFGLTKSYFYMVLWFNGAGELRLAARKQFAKVVRASETLGK